MSTPPYIKNKPLPASQNFNILKAQGLAYIQEVGGGEWNNLNASDAGVTILDQVCFALTELGYCNDFSVKDILTKRNGELQVKNQFYTPEEILTTSPVTIDDYRKYLIDALDTVDNVFILPVSNSLSPLSGVYQVYLSIGQFITDKKEIGVVEREVGAICKKAFYLLNKCRNIGELFLLPMPLQADFYQINGRIELESGVDFNKVLGLIRNKIRNYIFPEVPQIGYDKLSENGVETNDIFNGPILQNGWIQTEDLGEKKDVFRTIELYNLIQLVDGVKSASNLSFGIAEQRTDVVRTNANQILTFDLINSVAAGNLEICCNGRSLFALAKSSSNSFISTHQPLKNNDLPGAVINTKPEMPKGKFRDINNYYSIQNTFPEIFAVGANAINSNASDFQIAQSRQLKGYLTLFDQVLANQFSQLDNIDQLFSFKNSLVGNPSDKEAFYAVKDDFEKKHLEYPVPFLSFSPTYFYQSLYNIPNIRPLLKHNETFDFSIEIETDKELQQQSWEDYKLDPYNPYIRGLMDFMEDEKVNLIRRNDLLDHLLARHGESPLVVNTIINGSQYAGDSLKDQVIFKSLFLQNLGLLSYFRQKAYNFIGTNKISLLTPGVSENFDRKLLGDDTIDFLFNTEKIDQIEKLTEQDFISYSAIELKLSLLFGLKILYKNYIATHYDDPDYSEQIKLALWLIRERRGFILVETGLLLQSADFEIKVTTSPECGPYWKISENLSYHDATVISTSLQGDQETLADQLEKETFTAGNVVYPVKKMEGDHWGNQEFKPIPCSNYFFAVRVNWSNGDQNSKEVPLFTHSVELFFPDFLKTPEFKNRLDLFLANAFPVHVLYKAHFIDQNQLGKLIPAFSNWYNGLIYSSINQSGEPGLNVNSANLAAQIIEINLSVNG